jgi:hypothetical protein
MASGRGGEGSEAEVVLAVGTAEEVEEKDRRASDDKESVEDRRERDRRRWIAIAGLMREREREV